MLFHLAAVDPLGRFDPASLSDQTIMELFADQLGNVREWLYTADGDYQWVCDWAGVTCTDGNVTQITQELCIKSTSSALVRVGFLPPHLESLAIGSYFDSVRLRNRIAIESEKLPSGLKCINIRNCNFTEGLDFVALFASLEALETITFLSNRLGEMVDLSALPRTTEDCALIETELFGRCQLVGLPDRLIFLNCKTNRLEGEIDLTQLPASLKLLDLSENKLEGKISLQSLPDRLQRLKLAQNAFIGGVDLRGLPVDLRELDIQRNNFTGVLALAHVPGATVVQFQGCKFDRVVR